MHLQTRLLLAARPLHDVYLGTRQRQLRVLGLLRVGRAAFQAFRRDVLTPARVEVGRIRYGSLVASCKCLPPSAMQLQGDGEGQRTGQEGLCVGRLTPRTIRSSPPGNGFGSLCILAGTVALYCSFCTQNFSRGLLFPSLWPSRRQGSPLWADLHSSRTCASCCASGKASTSTMNFFFLKCRTSNLC